MAYCHRMSDRFDQSQAHQLETKPDEADGPAVGVRRLELITGVLSARFAARRCFCDFKSRGFGLEVSQLQRTDRMGRLILIMSLALYWAVSTGPQRSVSEQAALPVERSGRGSPVAAG